MNADPRGTASHPVDPTQRGASQEPVDPSGLPSTVRVRVFVDGRVQGVWFRQSAAQEAIRLGVSGWIRNLPDRRVEAVYEGPRGAIEEMLTWTRHGPEQARVAEMTIHDEEPRGERGFSIR